MTVSIIATNVQHFHTFIWIMWHFSLKKTDNIRWSDHSKLSFLFFYTNFVPLCVKMFYLKLSFRCTAWCNWSPLSRIFLSRKPYFHVWTHSLVPTSLDWALPAKKEIWNEDFKQGKFYFGVPWFGLFTPFCISLAIGPTTMWKYRINE